MATSPNILFIMTDQCRADALGCVGGWARTPHLDRLAGEGLRFANCVTNSPVCIPARVSLATGQYPHSTHVWNNRPYTLPPTAPTWMRAIREAGYRTSVFGKTHLHPHHGDLREREHLLHAWGLDDVDEIGGPRASARVLSHMTARWRDRGLWEAYQEDYADRFAHHPTVVRPSVLPLEEYADVYVGQRAREYLATYDRDQPWFCWVSFGGPHEPWDTPEPWANLHRPEAMPAPRPRPQSEAPARPRGIIDQRPAQDLSAEHLARMRADYAGNVALIDDQIGQLLATVAARGELDRTVIAFTSDHGEHNGDAGLVYKETFLDGAVRVPMVVRTPATAAGKGGGTVHPSPCEWLDLGPTLAELAGAELAYEQFGRSFAPLLNNPARPHRAAAVSELSGEIMFLTEAWKLVLNREGRCYHLIDVHNDPEEEHNLAGTTAVADLEADLRQQLLERLCQTQSHQPWLPPEHPRG